MNTTASNLIRWAGLSAVPGGSLFIGIQAVHPPEALSSVTTSTWAIVHYAGVGMCFLDLLGIAGIYARQVEHAGWLGLAGFLLLSLLPHEFLRTAAVPFGLALAWLGHALWSARVLARARRC